MCRLCDRATSFCYNPVTYMGAKTSYSDVLFSGQLEKTFEHLIKPLHQDQQTFCFTFESNGRTVTTPVQLNQTKFLT